MGCATSAIPSSSPSVTSARAPTRSSFSTSARPLNRGTILDLARRTAERLFIPLTIGGGIRTIDDMASALCAGADKVGVNSAAVHRPAILTEGARRFGSQCIVASIDARREGDSWRVYTSGARIRTELDAVQWARECVSRGAGEILLTSIDAMAPAPGTTWS